MVGSHNVVHALSYLQYAAWLFMIIWFIKWTSFLEVLRNDDSSLKRLLEKYIFAKSLS